MADCWRTAALSEPRPTAGSGVRYSLAALLLLTLVVAVSLGGIQAGLAHSDPEQPPLVVVGGLMGLLVGASVGLTLGLGRLTRLRSGLTGTLVGALSGLGAGLLAVLPTALQVLLPGAFVLLLFAAGVRWLSRRSG